MLELRGVTKRYGERTAVESVSIKVEAGTVVAVIGPNGAGKSTTFRLISGLLYPDAGQILWDGQDLHKAMPAELRGFLPEQCGLYQSLEVEPLLYYWARLRKMDRAAIPSAVDRWISRFDLGSKRRLQVRQLSKGNQQKVQLAACLIHSPKLLVLDEPFSGLDPVSQDLVSGVLREQAVNGAAILISAHQLGLIERLADTVMLMRAGRLVDMPAFGRSGCRIGDAAERTIRVHVRPGVPLVLDMLPPHQIGDPDDNQVLITFPAMTLGEFTRCLSMLAATDGVIDLEFSAPDLHRTYVRSLSTHSNEGSDGSPHS